jgi:primosomal protein N' (replication factor Y)
VVVIDEHDEAYQEERTPTWNARDVVVERARRAGAPCVLVSPCPSLEALATTTLVTTSRREERGGWPAVEIVDRREEPPGMGLYSARLVAIARQADSEERVVCVLNRKGRARLLACATCSELARCEKCDAAVESSAKDDPHKLVCRRCLTVRPLVCLNCGGSKFRVLRAGVSRAREDLERLVGRPVAEVSADVAPGPPPPERVLVGTEAVLHRLSHAQVVAFLDFDQELLAPRYRASERALGLLARAARILGGRADKTKLVIQTMLPDHEVIDAAVHADPARLTIVESARRAALGFPPERALALVSGDGGAEFAAALRRVGDLDVMGPASGQWMVRAADHQRLCDALAATPRPKGRTRIMVDPLRA